MGVLGKQNAKNYSWITEKKVWTQWGWDLFTRRNCSASGKYREDRDAQWELQKFENFTASV